MISSAYDYVISETLGFHVDYEKTLGQQYNELKKSSPEIGAQPRSKFDAVIEKCEVAIRSMHRPIVKSQTSDEAVIEAQFDSYRRLIGKTLTRETYEYIAFTEQDKHPLEVVGSVSSYNINTFKGRIFVHQEWRPIPFELAEGARHRRAVALITESLRLSADNPSNSAAEIKFLALRNTSRSGRLKKLTVLEVFK